ncbi:uncharacterized protein LOC112142445 isoform X2 [Oryzias melastigma]|uniref:uncharacterized protein LOC112142445 isoform X2 n=1 Tax=Oryzias melastigma TaxID=30732 RepID=UPI00168CE8BB|nr:uncharacterized protein LOC112142445 isoform X2 [Oryzias melastigma]
MKMTEEWKSALIKILEELDGQQYEKTLLLLEKIPKGKKEDKSREQMAQTIIEHYGEESVLEIDRIMKEIPRMDYPVQKLLQPFVEKRRSGKKRKREAEPEAGRKILQQNSAPGSNKIQMVADSSGKNKEPGKKRKVEANPKTGERMLQQKSAAGSKKNQVVSDSSGKNKEPGRKRKLEANPKTGGRMLQQNSAAGSDKNQVVSDSSGKNKEPGRKRKLEADPKTGGRMLQQNSAAGKKRKLEDDPKTGLKIVQQNSAAGSEKKQVVSDSSAKNKEPGKKKKLEANPKTGLKIRQQKSAAGSKKNQVVSDSSGKNKEPGDLKSPQLDEVQPSSSWRKPIAELQNGVDLSQKIVVGKVVEKFVLRSCEANTKEKFCLAIADDSGCIEVMVYGEKAFHFFKKGHFYNFRNVIVEENMIFTTKSKTSRAGKLDVPKKLELKARMLTHGQDPAVSIDEIKLLDKKKRVSVEGTVTEIGKIESVVIKKNQTEKNIQKFKLEDSTDSIDLTLWGKKNIQHLKGVSVGDTVKVTNVMTNHYRGTVSLNSTDSTRIFKLKCATLQIVQLEIIGIKKARKLQTELEAVRDEVAQTFSVKSAVLAEALGIQQGTDFEDRLLEKIPCSVKAEIEGDKILKLSAIQNEERVQMRM